MSKAYLVCDLDDTLVDSSSLKTLRDRKKWKECVSQLHRSSVFNDIDSVIRDLKRLKIPVAVVTNSVSYYASAMLDHHRLDVDALVAWHDTKSHKPEPEPIRLAQAKLGMTSNDLGFGLGDSKDDCLAYKAAGLVPLGAGWSPALDRSAVWHAILASSSDLITVINAALQKIERQGFATI